MGIVPLPTNPVLRDVTERVIVASKGRFGRAKSPKERRAASLPSETSIRADDFMALTLDVWTSPRVGQPGRATSSLPSQLPQRLIELLSSVATWSSIHSLVRERP